MSTATPCLGLGKALCVVAASLPGAHAADLLLQPVADASIFGGTPQSDALADGAGSSLWLSTTAEGLVRRILLRFDLSVLPPGSRLTHARLVLYESRSRADHDVSVHRLLASWREGPADAGSFGGGVPAGPGDVTWRQRGAGLGPWLSAGGDFVAQASAVQRVGLPNQTYAWTGAGLLGDLQAWQQRPQDNHGWILLGDELTQQSAKRFESRENTVASLQPRLEIGYEPQPEAAADGEVPLPAWALLLLGGLLARGLRGVVRSDQLQGQSARRAFVRGGHIPQHAGPARPAAPPNHEPQEPYP